MDLSKRQQQIIAIVKESGPITGEQIAERLNLTRATLRPDLAILTMVGFLDARPRVGYFYTGKTGSEIITEKLMKYKVETFQSMPIVVKEDDSAYDAISAMFLSDVGTLFAVDQDNNLVGVVSRKDLLRASIGNQVLQEIPVHIIMTRMPNVAVCYPDELLVEAANRLIDKQIDSLPVIERSNEAGAKVVGRITKTTITKAFVELARNELM